MRDIPELDIADVLEHYGSRVLRASRKATCVLHDDHDPSMSVNEAQGLWFCFTCDKGGDAIQLIMEVEHVEFSRALDIAEELARDGCGGVRATDRPASSLLPGRTGHRPGRRAWKPPWVVR